MGEEQNMTFWDHLEVLRWMLFRIAIALLVMIVGCFIAMPYIFDDFILGPTDSKFFIYRLFAGLGGDGRIAPDFSADFHVDIININVASQFMTHISTSFWLSLVLIFPFIIYELWSFLKPALYDNEIPAVKGAFFFSTLLFYAGCAVGYCVVFPMTFRFLSGYTIGNTITNQISLNSYMSIFLGMVFIMGVVFELPILAWILSKLGILRKGLLREYRRYAIVVMLILAAIITPSGDPFTLLIVFLPLYLLYGLSILVVKE
ncbi:MAG: twin-arginine translocase subunit TatC [Bacteroidales bacterium]|nr:twin-arginine translocase subunit TatC [Bacteroidales bacterium]